MMLCSGGTVKNGIASTSVRWAVYQHHEFTDVAQTLQMKIADEFPVKCCQLTSVNVVPVLLDCQDFVRYCISVAVFWPL
jgi:hypothetical protein